MSLRYTASSWCSHLFSFLDCWYCWSLPYKSFPKCKCLYFLRISCRLDWGGSLKDWFSFMIHKQPSKSCILFCRDSRCIYRATKIIGIINRSYIVIGALSSALFRSAWFIMIVSFIFTFKAFASNHRFT